MTYYANNAEGAANGVTVSATNSDDNGAGDALDVVSGSREFSTAQYNNGATSIKCFGTSGNTGLVGWTLSSSSVSTRVYFRIPSAPGATSDIMQFRNTGNGGGLQLRTDRKLAVVNDASAAVFTAATACDVDTWYRLEIAMAKGTDTSTGVINFAYYLGDSTSAIETYSVSNANCGTDDWTGVRWGKLTGIAFSLDLYFDDFAASTGTTTLLGPMLGASALTFSTARNVKVDCTGSVGTLTCVQDSGTSVGSIAGPTSSIFTITLPDHKDVLVFTVSADGDGAAVTDTFKVYPDNLSNMLVLGSLPASTLANWE